jgi:hypothetical protein
MRWATKELGNQIRNKDWITYISYQKKYDPTLTAYLMFLFNREIQFIIRELPNG